MSKDFIDRLIEAEGGYNFSDDDWPLDGCTLPYMRVALVEGGELPVRATKGAAGYDMFVRAVEDVSETAVRYSLGVRIELPEGYCALLMPRSSVYKRGLLMANSVGLIDSDYRGELSALFVKLPGADPYKVGERAAQLVIVAVETPMLHKVSELSVTDRGENGYGSTGK